MTRRPVSHSLLSTLTLYVRAYAFKVFVSIALRIFHFLRAEPHTSPTLVRTYPCRPTLPVRIFFPSSYGQSNQSHPNAGSSGSLLPLYLDVHGGGFLIGDPLMDDAFCSSLASSAKILVVALNYRKTPGVSFPVPVQDVTALMHAVVTDPTLPIDKHRIAVGGFSAGANLALAAILPSPSSPLRRLIDSNEITIRAAVPIYPVLEFVSTYEEKFRTRRHQEGGYAVDMLSRTGPLFVWAYVPPEIEREDPRLSPLYADVEYLPDSMFVIGAENDMLCHEAELFAEKLAKARTSTTSGNEERVVLQGLQLPDVEGWKEGAIRWERLRGWPHGFTHGPERGDPEREKRRKEVTRALYERISVWLGDVFRE